MNPDIFAEWLHRQGHKVVRSASSYWHSQGPGVYQAFPYHWIIRPPEDELLTFLRQNHAIGLRYSTPVDAPWGCLSYHVVYEKGAYGYEDLGKWSRKNVRRGLKNCRVAPVSFPRLAEEGLAMQLDTLARQGRRLKMDQETWQRVCMSAADLPGFEAWGAFVGPKLTASVITFQNEDCCQMLYQHSLSDYLPMHVNNALSFVVTQTMSQRPEIRALFYALHSLDAPASMDEFKLRMGYTAKPVRQRVVFHPFIQPIFNKLTHAVVKGLLRWRPGQPTLAKAEGMIRFHLQGKLPLEKQERPAGLADPGIG